MLEGCIFCLQKLVERGFNGRAYNTINIVIRKEIK